MAEIELGYSGIELKVGVLVGGGRVVVVGVVGRVQGGVPRGRGRSALVWKHGEGVVIRNHDEVTTSNIKRPQQRQIALIILYLQNVLLKLQALYLMSIEGLQKLSLCD